MRKKERCKEKRDASRARKCILGSRSGYTVPKMRGRTLVSALWCALSLIVPQIFIGKDPRKILGQLTVGDSGFNGFNG